MQPGDEVVRIDREPGRITFRIRREDRSLKSVTLVQPIWTHIKEIGFIVHDAVVSEADPEILGEIKKRHPHVQWPDGLRQLHVLDQEGTKISVIFANEESPDT
jgi:hypothetical protein